MPLLLSGRKEHRMPSAVVPAGASPSATTETRGPRRPPAVGDRQVTIGQSVTGWWSAVRRLDEGYSLDAQVRAVRARCAERGWEVAGEPFVEDARSARYEDLNRRPTFKALLEAADARAFDVVLVHKLDRFARNLRVTLETLERLDHSRVGSSRSRSRWTSRARSAR
jgi:hypothetical protein